jgi:hypothetical protein
MAPRKPKRHLEAAPVAVAQYASHRKGSRHAASSRTQSNVSEEEFDLQELEDGAETSDSSGLQNLSPEPERQDTGPRQAEAPEVLVQSNNGPAYDLIYFFDGFEPAPGKGSSKSKEEAPEKRVCNLCSYVGVF